MREHFLNQMRTLCTRPGKQKTWVSQLSDENLYELFQRLRNGETSRSIAKVVQKKWGISPKSSIHSVAQGITKFKKRIANLLLCQAPSEVIVLESNDKEPINDLIELEEISSRQYARIKQMMDEEQETGLKNPHLNRDIQALTALNKAITKRREWEMIHSGYNPVKQQKLMCQQDQMKKQFDNLLTNLGDEGRERMVKASKRLMEMLEKRVVTLELDPDGKYIFPSK